MKITIQKLTNINLAHRAINSTMSEGFDAKAPLDEIYRWEHSPSRSQLFWIEIDGLQTFVSVHFVRHAAVGQQHYVRSMRADRGGKGQPVADRNTPVFHTMLLNAQHLIDMSRKRLCYKASVETRELMEQIKEAIKKIDPDLAKYMVKNCEYRNGICSEPKSCGYIAQQIEKKPKWKDFDEWLQSNSIIYEEEDLTCGSDIWEAARK